nr:FMN-dependent NADH-azoreductase [Xanthomonas citri pv. fuscans]
LGIDDIRVVRAEGVAYSPQHRADALASALAGLGEEEEVAVSA